MNCVECQAALPADRGRVVCPGCGASFHYHAGTLIARTGDVLPPERRAILVNWLLWARWQAVIQRSA